MFNRAKLLVFVGPDGSGKTTIIEKLRSRLSPKYKVKVNHIRFNLIPRAGNLKKCIYSLFRLKFSSPYQHVESNLGPPERRYVYGPNFPLWKIVPLLSYEIFDFLFAHLVLFRRAENSILMFDRYFYDYYTEKDWSNTPFWLMNFFLFLAPNPDYIFFMENTSEEIHKRKNELAIDDIEIVNKRTVDLLCNKKNFVPINTNNSPDETAEIVLSLLREKGINVG